MKVICGKKYAWYTFVDDNTSKKEIERETKELDDIFKKLNKALKK
jgi:hypothetical protein